MTSCGYDRDGRVACAVLVAGGAGTRAVALSSAELYSPTGRSWTGTGSLATARTLFQLVLLKDGTGGPFLVLPVLSWQMSSLRRLLLAVKPEVPLKTDLDL